MASPHAVDIPITNLDDEDDDFGSTREALDPNVLRDDFEMDDGITVFGRKTFASKLKSAFVRLTQRGYNRVPDQSMMGIELSGRYGRGGVGGDGDADSFDLSDEEFLARRQKDTIVTRFVERGKRYSVRLIIGLLIITVIVLAALLGKRSKSSDTPLKKKLTLTNGTNVFYPTTILISLDGFHPHYISESLTPTLHKFFIEEYGTPYMIPSFPSSTFPNHWTIATGLYPESHGIVGNKFYDPLLDKQFINTLPQNSLDPIWWGGQAIWSTAELQGVRTAIHMFPGSEVKFPKGNPTELDPFNGTEALEVKTNRLLGWLDRPVSERPELIISYVPTIDTLGHEKGIDGPELEKGLQYVDSYVKNITEGINDRNLTDIVNLVILSDHGMAPTSNDRLVYLDDIVNITKIQHIDGFPLYGLRPFAEYSVDELYQELQDSFVPNKGYSVYLREDLPREWKFGGDLNHPLYKQRIAPLWVIPDVGYIITTYDEMERKGGDYNPKGVHGYNNTEVLMRAIFLGTGPYFREKALEDDVSYKVKPFVNVEVYNILCDMLELIPVENNGTTNVISAKNILSNDWVDSLAYPNVGFKIDELNNGDSTYDLLYRPVGSKKSTTTLQPQQTTSTVSEKVEEVTPVPEEQENKMETTTPTEQSTSDTPPTTTTTTIAEDETSAKPHKSIWDSLGDTLENLEEGLEELGDDIKEGAEDLIDSIEDAFDNVKGDHDNDD